MKHVLTLACLLFVTLTFNCGDSGSGSSSKSDPDVPVTPPVLLAPADVTLQIYGDSNTCEVYGRCAVYLAVTWADVNENETGYSVRVRAVDGSGAVVADQTWNTPTDSVRFEVPYPVGLDYGHAWGYVTALGINGETSEAVFDFYTGELFCDLCADLMDGVITEWP